VEKGETMRFYGIKDAGSTSLKPVDFYYLFPYNFTEGF
jgi:hypothetical protein